MFAVPWLLTGTPAECERLHGRWSRSALDNSPVVGGSVRASGVVCAHRSDDRRTGGRLLVGLGGPGSHVRRVRHRSALPLRPLHVVRRCGSPRGPRGLDDDRCPGGAHDSTAARHVCLASHVPAPGHPRQDGGDDRPRLRRPRRTWSRRRVVRRRVQRLRVSLSWAGRATGHPRRGRRNRVPHVDGRVTVLLRWSPLPGGGVSVASASRAAPPPTRDHRWQRRTAERRARRPLGRRVQRQQRRPVTRGASASPVGHGMRVDCTRPWFAALVRARQPARRYQYGGSPRAPLA